MKILSKFFAGILVFSILLCGCTQNQTAPSGNTSTGMNSDTQTSEVIAETTEASPKASIENAEKMPVKQGSLITESFESKALSKNMIEQNTTRKIDIYLPPSYNDSSKKYPVLYYLHGYGGTSNELLITEKLSEAMQAPDGKEFIVVGVYGSTKYGGSFYTNSPVIGNWEDFVTYETVAYIDSHFRTIKEPAARGLVGFSMGGYGAANIGLKHPDVFSAVYAICPGIITPDGFEEAFKGWENDLIFKKCYGSAFSPDIKGESPYYSSIPKFDDTEQDNKIIQNWENGFGHFEDKLSAYMSGSNRLSAIGLIYSEEDFYSWIPKGTKYFGELLKSNNLPVEIKESSEGHQIPTSFIKETMIPFFSKYLKSE